MHPAVRRIIESPKISQRTPEWYEYRKNRVTASEASTIIAKGKGYDRVFEQKVGLRDSYVSSEYMTIGTENEEAVVVLYRQKYPDEQVFHDLSIIPHQTLDFVAASLDACTSSGINVEIKTVFKDRFVNVSKMYYDQVQLQMEVADLDRTHLVQHYLRMPGQPIVVHEILRDREWFETHRDTFKEFVDKLLFVTYATMSIVSRRVKIPKKHISLERVTKDLVLRDSRPAEYASREPFVCFKDVGDGFIVPKMYGTRYIRSNNLSFEDRQKEGQQVPSIAFSGSLRQPQIKPVRETIRALETEEGGVMSLYCGFGKTTCSLAITCHFKRKTIILVHTTALLEQWKKRIEQFVVNASVGVLQRDEVDVCGRTHVIALMQSVSRRNYPRELLDTFGLMIVDEAHHVCASQLSRCVAKVGCKLRIGLSATPMRKDGMTQFLFDAIGPICAKVEREHQQVLVDVVWVTSGPSNMVFLNRNGKQSPNIAKMINNLCDTNNADGKFRTALVVEAVVRALKEDRHVIVLSDRRDHLKSMRDILQKRASGIDVGFMVGGTKPADIAAMSECRVLMATYAYCSEGLDVPSLDTCVFATPRSDIVQCCGRILRYHPSKRVPRVVDFVDDCHVFHGQARKRMKYYNKLGASVFHLDETLQKKDDDEDQPEEKTGKKLVDFPFTRNN